MFSGIGIVSAAVVLIILGLVFQWYMPRIKPLSEVVLEVNDTSFKMDYYLDSFRYQTQGQSEQIIQYFIDPVANTIVESELARQHANEEGYQVTRQEIDEALAEYEGEINDSVRDYTSY